LKDGLVRDLDVSIASNDELMDRYARAIAQRPPK